MGSSVSITISARTRPAGTCCKLCRAEACQSLGADALAAHSAPRLEVDWHGTTSDGAVTLEPVFCLGLCAIGPSALLDGRPLGRLDAGTDRGRAGRRWHDPRLRPPRRRRAGARRRRRSAALLRRRAPGHGAARARDHAPIKIVRTGSRGLFWLEPMVEVETPAGRIAYGPVTAGDVPGLLAAGMLDGGAHNLRLGKPEDLPFLARQTRFTFARCGIIDPLSIDDYRAHGGLKGLRRALELGPARIVEEVTKSGLRGRGGAGFPTGIKWKTTAEAAGARNTSCATPTRAIPAPTPTAC